MIRRPPRYTRTATLFPSTTLFRSADGFLFVTPEHNRSVPAALKNALDIGSRPASKSVWGGRPGAVISASPSSQGGVGANNHLRQSLVCLNISAMPNPRSEERRLGKGGVGTSR